MLLCVYLILVILPYEGPWPERMALRGRGHKKSSTLIMSKHGEGKTKALHSGDSLTTRALPVG